jgi:hypothetical protein
VLPRRWAPEILLEERKRQKDIFTGELVLEELKSVRTYDSISFCRALSGLATAAACAGESAPTAPSQGAVFSITFAASPGEAVC